MTQASAAAIRSLMIVDDSTVQREHAVRLTRGLGVGLVHEARHGGDALLQLEQLRLVGQPPDALIIDLEMPVMDGVQLIQQLCERGIDIPFVIASTRELTLIDAVATMARALGRPATGALQKPFGTPKLQAALDHCMQTVGPRSRSVVALNAVTPIDAGRLAAAVATQKIVAHYQPKVDMRTALSRGVEVLARWDDPVLGMVAPDAFIAAAELYGLIQPLTMSILEQSLAQAARWRSRGIDLSIAVNLSPSLLGRPALVDEIGERLARHGARPEQVVLEITESALIADDGAALGSLARLRLHGYGLSIDDYGTGFSSMQQLSRIPFTELKIDRSFVHGAHRSEPLRVILQSAIEMASRLSITSVAEGVETLADWQLLQSLGCGLVQGWLVGKAMPGDALRGWLRRHAQQLPLLRLPRRTLADGAAAPTPVHAFEPLQPARSA